MANHHTIKFFACLFAICLSSFLVRLFASYDAEHVATPTTSKTEISPTNRSPVDLILTKDEKWLLTANQHSNSVSLVDVKTGKVCCEIPCGIRPSALALTPDKNQVLVTGTLSGDLTILSLEGEKLKKTGHVFLNYFQPRGVAVSPDGTLAYVALTSGHKIAVIDLDNLKVVDHIPCGLWPRYLAISPDGKRMVVGVNGDAGVSVIDTKTRKTLFQEKFVAINLGQMHITSDSRHVYVPWTVYLSNPINRTNIERGWVMGNRIARIDLNEHRQRQAMSLDPAGNAAADPFGLAVSPKEDYLVCTASGTHELLVFRTKGLPLEGNSGPGDTMNGDLRGDRNRFYRIPLGGRPMFVRYSKDNRHVYFANYFLNAIQVVDVPARKIVRTIPLGGPKNVSLARKGEAIFHDATRTLDHWYSCHTCHYEGHTNAVPIDTNSDGTIFTPKSVLSLRNVTKTPPWNWHGSQKNLAKALNSSLTNTMLGGEPSNDDMDALIAYLGTLSPPRSPYRNENGSLTTAAKRGKELFQGKKANCIRCHAAPYYTTAKNYDVGLGSSYDKFSGFNPPSLLGIHDRIRFGHDGRSTTLEQFLDEYHNPARLNSGPALTEREMSDLIAFLKSQ